MYTPLTTETVTDYIKQSPLNDKIFEPNEELKVIDLSDGGNVNLIFRVISASKADHSVIVKQALPYARRYPDGMMPLTRAKIEHDLLAIQEKYCPGLTPKIYYYDDAMHVNVM